jgi:hypothetical protein
MIPGRTWDSDDTPIAVVIAVVALGMPIGCLSCESGKQESYRVACDQRCGTPGIVDYKGLIKEWRCVCPASATPEKKP